MTMKNETMAERVTKDNVTNVLCHFFNFYSNIKLLCLVSVCDKIMCFMIKMVILVIKFIFHQLPLIVLNRCSKIQLQIGEIFMLKYRSECQSMLMPEVSAK